MKIVKRLAIICLVVFCGTWISALSIMTEGDLQSNWSMLTTLSALNNLSLYGGIGCGIIALILKLTKNKEKEVSDEAEVIEDCEPFNRENDVHKGKVDLATDERIKGTFKVIFWMTFILYGFTIIGEALTVVDVLFLIVVDVLFAGIIAGLCMCIATVVLAALGGIINIFRGESEISPLAFSITAGVGILIIILFVIIANLI